MLIVQSRHNITFIIALVCISSVFISFFNCNSNCNCNYFMPLVSAAEEQPSTPGRGFTVHLQANPSLPTLSDRERSEANIYVDNFDNKLGDSSQISSIDSDYLNLYMAPTTLSLDGHKGVFAKHFIKAHDIICEYRGPIVKSVDAKRFRLDNNYTWELTDPDGDSAYIMGENVCAFINDCVTILNNPKIMDKDFLDSWKTKILGMSARGEATASWMPEEIQCSAGREENVVSLTTSNGSKVLIVAKRDIMPGEELFLFYGNNYWHPRALSLLEHNHMDVCGNCVAWFR
jgi:hypothetical protein